jgi:hypothetical protein
LLKSSFFAVQNRYGCTRFPSQEGGADQMRFR